MVSKRPWTFSKCSKYYPAITFPHCFNDMNPHSSKASLNVGRSKGGYDVITATSMVFYSLTLYTSNLHNLVKYCVRNEWKKTKRCPGSLDYVH